MVPSRFVLEFDWRGLRLDEDTWITMRKVDGWQRLTQKLADQPIDLAA